MATNPTTNKGVGVAIFARAPIPNQAKTRLISLLGSQGAAHLQLRLMERAVVTALRSKVGPVALWCMPDTDHPSFQDIERRYGIALHTQAGTDLGARMAHAFSYHTPEYPLLLMGTDCPAVTAPLLSQCAGTLVNHDLVLLPVEDGGYCLIGAKRVYPSLFDGIPWSTENVMALTRGRAREAGLSFAEPALLWDIDRPEDYERAVSEGLISTNDG